jgi:hypothetical protein
MPTLYRHVQFVKSYVIETLLRKIELILNYPREPYGKTAILLFIILVIVGKILSGFGYFLNSTRIINIKSTPIS